MGTVYDFLGYKLIEANYFDLEGKNTKIAIAIDGKLNDNIYDMFINVTTDFSSQRLSNFKFEARFKINDKNWYEQLNDKERKMVFSSVAFPFIREKIYTISSNNRPGLLIPMLDLKNIDASKEIVLTRSFLNN